MARWTYTTVLVLAWLISPSGPSAAASRMADGRTSDWCFVARATERSDDSASRLSCGACAGATLPVACVGDADCDAGEACSGAHDETVWFDARADAAVNDLWVVATSQDTHALYFVVVMSDGLDPEAIPNIQIALDTQPGGTHDLFDPNGAMVEPGVCSESGDRGCTAAADCDFFTSSLEPSSGSEAAGQSCLGLGVTPLARVGLGPHRRLAPTTWSPTIWHGRCSRYPMSCV